MNFINRKLPNAISYLAFIGLLCISYNSMAADAIEQCDQLASDESDSQKKSPGILFDDIKTDSALSACKAALAITPNESRLQYQYARVLLKAKDGENALKWYRKAEENGHLLAAVRIGDRYREGGIVNKDLTEAVKWYEKASKKGDPVGQYYLARAYALGEGVDKNPTIALSLFKLSSEQGFKDATFAVGTLYLYGDGIKENFEETVRWYRKAAKQGHEKAIKRIAELDNRDIKFTDAEKNEQKLAAFNVAVFWQEKSRVCNKTYGFKLVEPRYGVITHDLDDYLRPFKLSSPVNALMTGVEFTCQNNKNGTKNTTLTYLVNAMDVEFDNRYRCQHSAYAYDNNIDSKKHGKTPRTNIEEWAKQCGFSTKERLPK